MRFFIIQNVLLKKWVERTRKSTIRCRIVRITAELFQSQDYKKRKQQLSVDSRAKIIKITMRLNSVEKKSIP